MFCDYSTASDTYPQDHSVYEQGFYHNGNSSISQGNDNSHCVQYSPSYSDNSTGQFSDGSSCQGQSVMDIFDYDPSHAYAKRLREYFDDAPCSPGLRSEDSCSPVSYTGGWVGGRKPDLEEGPSMPTSFPPALRSYASQPEAYSYNSHPATDRLAPAAPAGCQLDTFTQMTLSNAFSSYPHPYNVTPQTALHNSNGKPKRKRIINKEQRKAANVRERHRMTSLNNAFDGLRKRVPTFSYEKKLSRIETLKLAITYIHFMTDVLKGEDGFSSDNSDFDKSSQIARTAVSDGKIL